MNETRTLCELFEGSVRDHDRAAAFLIKKSGAYAPVSSREIAGRVRAVACGLQALGVERGDRVAILSENRLEWAITDYAILLCGAISVPIYATLQPAQVRAQLADCGAAAAFVSDRAQLDKLGEAAALPALQLVVAFDAGAAGAGTGRAARGRRVVDLAAVESQGAGGDLVRLEATWRALRSDDLATIVYTSGTSGDSKGVMLTHANIIANIEAMLRRVRIDADDTCLSFLPLSHVLERTCGHLLMWHVGATIAYAESVDSVAANLLEVRPTVLISVPRLYEKMNARILSAVQASPPLRRRLFAWAQTQGRERVQLEQQGRPVPAGLALRCRLADRLVFAKLRARVGGRMRIMVSGGAPLSAAISEFFFAAGLPILEGYGLTETSPVLAVNPRERIKIGSVGPPLDNVELRIADDGEILARGPSIMRGYWNNDAATAEVLAGGWFHTGDVGQLDSDGYLRITDRLKDILVTAGGKKVAPQPIEARLKAFPYLAEAILIGDNRSYVSAIVIPNFVNLESHARTRGVAFGSRAELVTARPVLQLFEAFFAGVNADLAQFERIKRFRILERELEAGAGELTPSMKVRRTVVSKALAPVIDEMYANPAPATVGRPGGDQEVER
jgi:long-chain acyl-CoA synthetase